MFREKCSEDTFSCAYDMPQNNIQNATLKKVFMYCVYLYYLFFWKVIFLIKPMEGIPVCGSLNVKISFGAWRALSFESDIIDGGIMMETG